MTRRRAEAVLVGAGLLAIAGVIWAGTTRAPEEGSATGGQSSALGPGTRPAADCRVSYELAWDTGRSFAAALIVTNTGREAVDGWRLRFTLPSGQRVTKVSTGDWDQSGTIVEVTPDPKGASLAAGASTALSLTGRHRGTNAQPLGFDLDGRSCQAVVSGPGAGPASGDTETVTGGTGNENSGPGTGTGGTAAGDAVPPPPPPPTSDNSGPGGGGKPDKTKPPKPGHGGGNGGGNNGGLLPLPVPLPISTPSLPPIPPLLP